MRILGGDHLRGLRDVGRLAVSLRSAHWIMDLSSAAGRMPDDFWEWVKTWKSVESNG